MAYKGKSLDVLKKSDPGGFKARIAHLIATGNSSAVPTKYLPAGAGKILQQRNLKARLDAPVTPGSSLTNRDLAHEAQQAVTTQYQPQEQAMSTQEGQLVNQRANLPQYYQNYLGVLKGAQTQAGADAARTGANIQALGESAQKAATSQDTSVLAKLQQDSQRLGVQMDPSVAANAANAASSSRSVADAQAGTANLLGLAQQGLLRMTEAGAGLAQQEGLGKLNAQQSQLAQQRTALKREEGLANQAYRTKRRSDEVTSVATSSLAGVNAAAKAAGVEQGAKRVSIAQQNANTARKRQQQAGQPSSVAKPPSNYTGSPADWNALSRSARDAYVKAHPTKTSKSKTPKGPGGKDPSFLAPAGQQAVVQRVHKLAQYLNANQTWPGGPRKGKAMTWADKVNHLVSAQLEPQNLVDAAKSLAQNQRKGLTNTLGPSGASALHSAGAQVHGHFKNQPHGKKKPLGPGGATTG